MDEREKIEKEAIEEIRKDSKELAKEQEKISEKLIGISKKGIKDIGSSEEKLIEERKKKVFDFFKKTNIWVLVFLIIAIILGVYIRSLPMTDHGGNPGLWDITTNTWTLGPDLDPFLFLRYAKTIVENGSLPKIDMMRNVPLGFNTGSELQMVSYMIVLTYHFVNIFGDYSIDFAGAFMPVLLFALTIVAFFLFVREIFARKNSEDKNIKANLIAIISTFFMIVIPAFLSRTIAGIPEKESVAFFFMFLSFYLFLKAWKTEKLKFAIILGTLAGISTALMGLTWGGVSYIYITIAAACFFAFILNKMHKKEAIIYSCWLFVSLFITLLFTERFSLKGLLTSLDTGLAFLLLFAVVIHIIIWRLNLTKRYLEKIKLPKNITSLIFVLVLGIILVFIFLGPGFVIEKARAINQMMFRPVTGRWSTTVAENRQPYFTEWGSSFGPFIRNIPVLFWLFFIGSVVLFKKMLDNLRKKDAWILTGLYILFFFGLVFSRYSAHPSIFDGENFISKFIYYGFTLLLTGSLIYYYRRYTKEKNNGFEKINFEYLFLFSLFVLCLFTARSAVRLIMVLAPIAPIFVGFLVIFSIDKFRKTKDITWKYLLGVIMIVFLILSIFVFWSFYKQVKSQAYNSIPSSYTQQWQKAMSWVRSNTPENAVFAHWWDYGYWVQSIGNRATVTDGGNAINFWNYWTGRLVLTGDNQKDALEFLYIHNASYLLIDSSDIGKYGAFSSIGSDENYDRSSWIPTMISDEKQSQETRNGTTRIYQGGFAIDEDVIYNQDGKEIFLPSGGAAIIGIVINTIPSGQEISFNQPEAIFYYQNTQYKIPLRYIYFNKQFFDFKTGLGASVYVVPRVIQTTGQGVQIDNLGALMYISPRVTRGLFAQLYFLNDALNNFPAFKLTHSEPSLIVESLRNQNLVIDDFVYFQGIQGPIKIWKINYTGREEIKQEYLDTDASKYISWQL